MKRGFLNLSPTGLAPATKKRSGWASRSVQAVLQSQIKNLLVAQPNCVIPRRAVQEKLGRQCTIDKTLDYAVKYCFPGCSIAKGIYSHVKFAEEKGLAGPINADCAQNTSDTNASTRDSITPIFGESQPIVYNYVPVHGASQPVTRDTMAAIDVDTPLNTVTEAHHLLQRSRAINNFIQAAERLTGFGLDICLAVTAPKLLQFWTSNTWRSDLKDVIREAANCQANLDKRNRNVDMFMPQETRKEGSQRDRGYSILAPVSHEVVQTCIEDDILELIRKDIENSPSMAADLRSETAETDAENDTIVCQEMESDVEEHYGTQTRPETNLGKVPVQCRFCTFVSDKASILVKHYIMMHKAEKPYQCQYCNYKAERQQSLISHTMTHTGEAFDCEYCDYKTTNKDSLRIHIKRHTGDFRHHCHLCDYKTPRKYHLDRHLQQRHVPKPYECRICEFRTDRAQTLRSHLRCHTGHTFDCELCNYRSTRKDHLLQHSRSSHPEHFVHSRSCV